MEVSKKVPGKNHYSVRTDYLRTGRVHSYAHQIEAVIEGRPANVLEVGKGPGIVAAVLKTIGIEVTTLDVTPELEPDLVGSVTDIPAMDKSFDASLCCQVLEHLPFETFRIALAELRRVTKHTLVMSLPDVSPAYLLRWNLPFLSNFHLEFTRPRFRLPMFPKSRYDSMGHYWEIGYAGTTRTEVFRAIVESGWKIQRTWRVPEKSWHRFFSLNT